MTMLEGESLLNDATALVLLLDVLRGTDAPAGPPQPLRPSASTMRTRAKACGHCVSVTTPKRNGSRRRTGRSRPRRSPCAIRKSRL